MSTRYRFGDFDFDPGSLELWRRGRRVRLQPQPAKLLALLLRRAGEVVTREEIRLGLWSDALHVEFDQGINFSIGKLRAALDDSADHAVWIETLPRIGYRFRAGLLCEAATDDPLQGQGWTALQSGSLSGVGTGISPFPHSSAPAGVDMAPPPQVELRTAAAVPSRRTLAALTALALAALASIALFALRDARRGGGSNGAADSTIAGTELPEAARAPYARGLYLSRRSGTERIARGLAELRTAAVLAPAAGEPLTALAEGLLALHRDRPSPELLAEAELVSARAVRLAPRFARAHLARAATLSRASYDWRAAESEYRAALALDPGLAEAHRGFAALLATNGRFDEAIAAARRARELDPVCLAASADLGWILFLARHYEEAIVASREALGLDPANTLAHLSILYSELMLGREPAALAQANEHLAAQFAALGRPAPRVASLADYWRGSIDHLSRSTSSVDRAALALPRLHLGEDGAAMDLLLRGCREHSGRDAQFAAVNPLLASFREDPRLLEVLSCLGLESEAAGRSAVPPSVPLHDVSTVRG